VSSQQQSQGYKRRSSGKRTRPSQRGTATISVVPDLESEDGQETEAPSAEHPARTTSSRQSRERVTSTATRVRVTAPVSRTDSARSRVESIVNIQRFDGIRKFIREALSEIQKVIWPDRDTTRNLTLVVIAVSVILGLLLGGIDFVLFKLFEALP